MKNKCDIGWKTLCEKEKLLVTSNFSFSHNAFHSYIPLVRQNVALCGNGVIHNDRYKFLNISNTSLDTFWASGALRSNPCINFEFHLIT